MKKPELQEYNPIYQNYIDLVGRGDFKKLLQPNSTEIVNFFTSITGEKENFRYQQDKWTIKDVFMHMIDTERGFSYRTLVCIRLDESIPLYGLDEDYYASNVDVTHRTMESLIEEFMAVRESFSYLFRNVPFENFEFLGNGVGHKVSARALGYIAIGHAKHHLNVIKERYL